MHVGHSGCGGLNENGLYRLIYLTTWSPPGGTLWGGLGVALQEVTLGGAFGVSKDCHHSQGSLCPYLWIKI